MSNEGFVIDTPEGIAFFRLLQFIARLKIEINTGLKSRQPTLKIARQVYGLKSKTKQGALRELEQLRDQLKAAHRGNN